MGPPTRALVIAFLGPAVAAVGLIYLVADSLAGSAGDTGFRDILFGPGYLTIAVGLVVSFICIPLSFQVLQASEGELQVRIFEKASQAEAVDAAEEHGATEPA
jgi:hypothetical protein